MSTENKDSITYKIILIGDSSVGKTCFFKKMTTGNYNEKNISTIGVDRKSINITTTVTENGEEINKSFDIQLWDTAGQERFRSITKGYYKDSQGLLLLYDITNRESFDGLNKWITGIRDSLGGKNEKYVIILFGNKVDLANEDPDSRKVEASEAEKECSENDVIWGGECSAKDFTKEQLIDIFTKYTKEIYKKVGNISNKTSQVTIECGAAKKKKNDCAC